MRSRFCLGLFLLLMIGAAAIRASTPAVYAYTPAQRDTGLQVYRQWCATCHGDKGQGLTLEWRQTWPEDHQNCSLPKCHGPQHPPSGFEIKNNYVPALVGPGTLAKFHTAQDLFDYVSSRMPVGPRSFSGQEEVPGKLSQDEEWALTAFLLAAHGVAADNIHLDATTASQVSLAESRIAPDDLPQQSWWQDITPAAVYVTPALRESETPPSAPSPAREDTSRSEGAPATLWWPVVAGVGLTVALLGLTAVALRQASR